MSCAHERVEPSKTYEDGSIDGKCLDCGEDGFPIRDVAYEEFQKSEEGQYKCGFLTAIEMKSSNPEEYERIAARPLFQPPKKTKEKT